MYDKIKECGACVYYTQGVHCSFCSHPEATDKEKEYRYYNFSCDDKDKFKPKENV